MNEICEIPEINILLNLMMLSNTEVYEHSLSVAEYTEKILKHDSSFTEEEKDEIIKGALLHDVGKLFVPFNLSQAPRRLSEQEFNIIKIHTSLSYEIVQNCFSDIVKNICLYHHERPNGQGYPGQKKLVNIPREALLVQVIDIFDAMLKTRAYKASYTPELAIEEMKKEAYHFKLDDQYLKLLELIIKEDFNDKENNNE